MTDFLTGVVIGLGTGIAVFFGITVPFLLRRIANALEQIERREDDEVQKKACGN